MNKQSNTYTIIYVTLIVAIVGLGLSLVYQALHPMQERNMADDKKKQILAAAYIFPKKGESISELYDKHIIASYCVDYKGNRIEDTNILPFDINMSVEIKKPADERLLPVFECQAEGSLSYILPVYGAGLWGPIWGYVAVENNGDTIYGTYFAHQGETPGLGAEIEKTFFTERFAGKQLYTDGVFTSVAVVKSGQTPSSGAYVDAISGATITSHGVSDMLYNSLAPYNNFLLKLQRQSSEQTDQIND